MNLASRFLFACVMVTCLSPRVNASDWRGEYDKKIKAAQVVGALGDDFAGEHVNFYTGMTSFSATDISLPSNGMTISLGRSYTMEPNHDIASVIAPIGTLHRETVSTRLYTFGDWDLDVPNINTVMTQSAGWVVDTTTPQSRCSVVGKLNSYGYPATGIPPQGIGTRGWFFGPDQYWSGYTLHAGGQDQSLLLASLPNAERPSSGGPYHWTTNKDWWVSCLPTLAGPLTNGQPPTGEGYLAIAPDGTKYWFNWLSKRNVDQVSEYDDKAMEAHQPTYLFRAEYRMLVTRVEDRFGNWINYAWSNDEFSKLQSITGGQAGSSVADQTISLHYDSATGFVDSATDGSRTWTYVYTNGFILTNVVLPDATKWTYAMGSIDREALIPHCDIDEMFDPNSDYYRWYCFGGGEVPSDMGELMVGHPSGATAYFTFDVHYQYSLTSDRTYVFGLIQKVVTGAGLAPATWNYSYLPSKEEIKAACQTIACPGQLMTEQVNPDNSVTRRIFEPNGIVVGELHGSLGANGGGSQSITASAGWNPNLFAAPNPFTAIVPTWYREVEYKYAIPGSPMPYTVKVGVDPLSAGLPLGPRYENEMRLPPLSTTQYLQGVTFKSEVPATCGTGSSYCFTNFAQPTRRVASSTGGAGGNFTRTDTTTYRNDLSKWVIGLPETRGCVGGADCGTGLTLSRTDYDPVTSLPLREFGVDQLHSVASYTYGTTGLLTSVKDARNNLTSLSAYQFGTPTTIAFPDGTSLGASVNNRGEIGWVLDQLQSRNCYAYDPMSRLKQITYTSETQANTCDTSAYTQTNMGFVWEQTATEYGLPPLHWRSTNTTGNGRTTTYYDGRLDPVLVLTEDLANAQTRSFVVSRFDAMGRKVFSSYPVGALTTINDALPGIWTDYDALGRVTKVRQDSELSSPNTVLVTQTDYLSGFTTRVRNPRGYDTTTSFQVYDSPNTDEPRVITLPEGVTTTIARQPSLGKPLSVTRSGAFGGSTLSLARTYVYDANERLCQTFNPESGVSIVDYDFAGNLAWSAEGRAASGATAASCATDRANTPSSVRVVRTYDALDRPTLVTSAGGLSDQSTTYTPDGKPWQLTANNPPALAAAITTTYEYNRRGLLTAERPFGGSWLFTYAHDANGHLSSQTYDGVSVSYAPDALGRPTRVGTFASGVSYFPNGAIAGFTYGNGIVHTMARNARQLPEHSIDAYGASKFLDDTYAYDPNGNVTRLTDLAATGGNNRTWLAAAGASGYDGLDRLKSVTSANQWGVANYTYDPLDNLRTASTGASSYTYGYDLGAGSGNTNRLKTMLSNGGSNYSLTSDAVGNITFDTHRNQTYKFDVLHRLIDVVGKESYRYDGYGRRARVGNTTNTVVEFFAYDQSGRLLQDWSQRRNVQNAYIYLGNSLVAASEYNLITHVRRALYKHTDGLGSPVVTTDAARTVIGREAFTPYGIPVTPVDGVGYTGHYIDVGTGLTYMQQRYYDPQIGRFLSTDPVPADPDSGTNFNSYWYADNNPYATFDPDGRQTQRINPGDSEEEKQRAREERDRRGNAGGSASSSSGGASGSKQGESSREPAEGSFAKWIDGVAHDINPFMPAAECNRDGCSAGGWVWAGVDAGTAEAGGVIRAGGGRLVVRLGLAGEIAVRGAYSIGPRGLFIINGRLRIPDGINAAARTLSEIKNVKYQGMTSQLRDYAQYARANGLRFDLYMRPGAQLSGPLQAAIKAGEINLRAIP